LNWATRLRGAVDYRNVPEAVSALARNAFGIMEIGSFILALIEGSVYNFFTTQGRELPQQSLPRPSKPHA